MQQYCPVSCSDMKSPPNRKKNCVDVHEGCPAWAEADECETNGSVPKYCPLSCGKCKNAAKSAVGKDSCEDNHDNCSFWADNGECQNNPVYMSDNCRKSCGKCESEGTNMIDGAGADPGSQQRKEIEDTVLQELDKLLERTEKFGAIRRNSGGKSSIFIILGKLIYTSF